jgi:hypothetical protein
MKNVNKASKILSHSHMRAQKRADRVSPQQPNRGGNRNPKEPGGGPSRRRGGRRRRRRLPFVLRLVEGLGLLPEPETAVLGPSAPIQKRHTIPIYDGER